MPSPSSSLATLRPDLAESFMAFDMEMQRRGFIANRVMPVIETMSQAGSFGKIALADLLKTGSTSRAPRSGYSRGDWKFDDASYACEEHGWEEPIDDREARMYANYFDAETIASARAYEHVLSSQEQRVAAAVFNTGTFSPTAITNEWDDAANATPIADVEAAVQRVWAASGLWPNALVINRKVFRNLRNCEEIIDRIKYSGIDPRTTNINEAMLASLFDLEQIIVAGSVKNTAAEGQAASLAPIWSNEYAFVGVIARGSDFREPCVGRIFHWAEDGSSIGGTVESYRDETVRGDVIRVRHDVDEVVLYSAAGDLMSNITT